MPNAAGSDAAVQSDGRDGDHHSALISDLVSLIEHVQATMKLVESVIAGETLPGDQEAATNVFILDDLTPRYAALQATLNSCSAGLGSALQLLLDTGTSEHETDGSAGSRHLRLV